LSEFAAVVDAPPPISIDGRTPAEDDAGSDGSIAPVVPPEPAGGSGTTSTQGGSDGAPASDASAGSDPSGDIADAAWVPVPRADWREDATFAKECPEILQPAKSVRLAAIGKLRKDAAEVLQRIKPQQEHEVEHCLWPLFSEYAECVLDKMAEAELGSMSSAAADDYGAWLKSACLPAIIRDVCGPIFGQFPITLRYVVEQIGEVYRPDDLVKMRQVLWHMISDAVLPAQGSALFRLETRLTNALMEETVPQWEAKADHLRPATTSKMEPNGVEVSSAESGPSLAAPSGDRGTEQPTREGSPAQTATGDSVPTTDFSKGTVRDQRIERECVDLLLKIVAEKRITIETWARDHKLGRSTVFDWKAARVSGSSLKGKVSDLKVAAIEAAIKVDAEALGLSTRTSSD
jgi:hypothetical protein